jgi:hypothetical protein
LRLSWLFSSPPFQLFDGIALRIEHTALDAGANGDGLPAIGFLKRAAAGGCAPTKGLREVAHGSLEAKAGFSFDYAAR